MADNPAYEALEDLAWLGDQAFAGDILHYEIPDPYRIGHETHRRGFLKDHDDAKWDLVSPEDRKAVLASGAPVAVKRPLADPGNIEDRVKNGQVRGPLTGEALTAAERRLEIRAFAQRNWALTLTELGDHFDLTPAQVAAELGPREKDRPVSLLPLHERRTEVLAFVASNPDVTIEQIAARYGGDEQTIKATLAGASEAVADDFGNGIEEVVYD